MQDAGVQARATTIIRRLTAAAALFVLALFSTTGCQPRESPVGEAEAGAREAVESTAERGPVRFTVRAEPATITVGDRLTLTLEVRAPEAVEIEMLRLSEMIGPFDIRSARTPPDIPDGNVRRWTHRYTLDTFASGELEIPSLEVGFVDRRPERVENGSPVEGTLTSDPLHITVKSVLRGDEQEGDYRDIQESVDVPIPINWREYWPVAAAIIVVCAAVFLILWRARRKRVTTARERTIPPHIWAFSQLEALGREALPEQGRFHEFYFRLSDVVRQYIERRFGLRAPERTTEEFLRETRDDPLLSAEQKELLAGFLRAADMVKFARHEPALEECATAFEAARGFVEQTAPAPRIEQQPESDDHRTEEAA